MPDNQPVIDCATSPKMGISTRLCRGLIGAAVAAGVGWIASQLTVGLILARQLNSGQQRQIEIVLPFVWMIVGFISGAALDRRWLTARLRPICWGAVLGLAALMLLVRITLWWNPRWRNLSQIHPLLPATIGMEDVGLLSVPGALLIGGCLGWLFNREWRQIRRQTEP